MQYLIDGTKSLEDQRNTIGYYEQMLRSYMVSFNKASDQMFIKNNEKAKVLNIVSFEKVPLGQDIKILIVCEIESDNILEDIIKKQKEAGNNFIFLSTVYIGGQEKKAAVFRKA